MLHRKSVHRWFVATMVTIAAVQPAAACPFCSAVGQTLRQEMETMDAVVIARAADSELTRNAETGEVQMRVEQVLKGTDDVQVGEVVTAIYYGDVEQGRTFMLSGVMANVMQWSCLPLTPQAETYIVDITKLPKDNAEERLRFYHNYLEDEDSMLSRDAYDEFAVTPYEDIKKIREIMDHDQLIAWIQTEDMAPDRKRLYLTMLGVCGGKDDLKLLSEMLRSTTNSSRSGLDALIACYLTLAGEEGIALIDDLFMKNETASYADTYAAIMAIRFHGTEGGVIDRSALVGSLHHILNRPDLADLVIPDLARWQDWTQVARVKELFLKSDANNNWIRVPAVNYLRACPLPEAAEAIAELEKVDPDSVRRANTFFPVPKPAPATSPSTSMISPAIDGESSGTGPSRSISEKRYATSLPIVPKSDTLPPITPTSTAFASVLPNPTGPISVIGLALATVVVGQVLILTGGPNSSRSAEI